MRDSGVHRDHLVSGNTIRGRLAGDARAAMTRAVHALPTFLPLLLDRYGDTIEATTEAVMNPIIRQHRGKILILIIVCQIGFVYGADRFVSWWHNASFGLGHVLLWGLIAMVVLARLSGRNATSSTLPALQSEGATDDADVVAWHARNNRFQSMRQQGFSVPPPGPKPRRADRPHR